MGFETVEDEQLGLCVFQKPRGHRKEINLFFFKK